MYDLIVYCPNKKKRFRRPPKVGFYVEKWIGYWDIWRFITSQKGKGYYLLSEKDEYAGSLLCDNISFDIQIDLPDVSEEDRECLTPYRVYPQYIEDFKKVINYMLDCSPSKLVYVLARYQSCEKEVVLGTYSLDTFISLMENGKIYSNICYIISRHPNVL